jgi:hypothetical protein
MGTKNLAATYNRPGVRGGIEPYLVHGR